MSLSLKKLHLITQANSLMTSLENKHYSKPHSQKCPAEFSEEVLWLLMRRCYLIWVIMELCIAKCVHVCLGVRWYKTLANIGQTDDDDDDDGYHYSTLSLLILIHQLHE